MEEILSCETELRNFPVLEASDGEVHQLWNKLGLPSTYPSASGKTIRTYRVEEMRHYIMCGKFGVLPHMGRNRVRRGHLKPFELAARGRPTEEDEVNIMDYLAKWGFPSDNLHCSHFVHEIFCGATWYTMKLLKYMHERGISVWHLKAFVEDNDNDTTFQRRRECPRVILDLVRHPNKLGPRPSKLRPSNRESVRAFLDTQWPMGKSSASSGNDDNIDSDDSHESDNEDDQYGSDGYDERGYNDDYWDDYHGPMVCFRFSDIVNDAMRGGLEKGGENSHSRILVNLKACWPGLAHNFASCFDPRLEPMGCGFAEKYSDELFEAVNYVCTGVGVSDLAILAKNGRLRLEELRKQYLWELDNPIESVDIHSTDPESERLPTVRDMVEEETGYEHTWCKYGLVDVLTKDTVIVIKTWSHYLDAIRQVNQYAKCCPGRKKRIHFFGAMPSEEKMTAIRKLCEEDGIIVTVQK